MQTLTRWFLTLLLFFTFASRLVVYGDQSIFTDSLQNGWQNWGWATLDYNNTSPVHSGTKSVAVTITDNSYQAIYIAHSAFDSTPYGTLTFWINGGASGGQQLQVQGHAGGVAQTTTNLPALAANTWQQFSISLATLGVANRSDMDGFWIQDRIGAPQPTFYVDDISLVTGPPPLVGINLTTPTNGAAYIGPTNISLAANVTPNGHTINRVQFYNGAALLGEDLSSPYSLTWSNVTVGSYTLTARVIFDLGTASAGTNTSSAVNVTVATNTSLTITVDASANRHPISPLIYGVAFASPAGQLSDLNVPIHRSGGNTESRYNWQLNAHNHANDWFFESLDDGSSTPAGSADDFVTSTKANGAQPMLTIPMIGWVPKLGPGRARLASYAITNYGLQAANDWQYFAQAGNGIITNTSIQITTNNPNDANFLTNSAFQQAFVQHLTNRWGLSTNGGVKYYFMDNEHTLWHSTHRDVHPIGTSMQEIRDKMFDYANVVKSLDPNAIVLGPEEWGWPGYLYSGFDWQWAGNHNDYNPADFPDRSTNGGWDYGPWLLDQFRLREIATGKRFLDYFTYHIYPQGGDGGNDVSTATQLLRNRSTRSLWDTNYVDESWIHSIIKLIPRMKGWVATYYPGTKIGITEYNWGAEGHINGATAQADIFGIFGREGLDLATRWTTPATGSPVYNAMKMYRNYDGAKSTFGDTSISASGPNPDNVSTFAAIRSSDGALTVMLINKQLLSSALSTITLANFLAGNSAQVWQLTSANTITHLSNVPISGNSISTTLPPQSITLFIVPPGVVVPPQLRPGGVNSASMFDLWLDGQAGQKYIIQATTDFVNWTAIQTNTLASNSLHVILSAALPYRFFRAQWTQ
jgi:hypothetical protein